MRRVRYQNRPCQLVGKLQQYRVGAFLERIAIYITALLPTTDTGNRYILVVRDYFTQ